ncbi:aromatic ring-hydroxylating dioxygenase subunit alpha [Rhizorhabdus sp.]|uniref:aromatic ring-hydroxylating dioxygenase subunit alpha n=1 Tax=Rhizorhabdus sp. TaxID=1968843 RepID=UPI0019B9221B|nr:aromatic ring-hydroxylating dioxygenase subunit alpha [Rhizorhabdus sp.]MBD3759623.1 aromatic ring-hydroxylating dioxygenase subunit alpha [Rhizorhabdus sp.]
MACRLEQIEKVGDFATFDIGRESFLIVRTASDAYKAYYNVCQHRGRRLKKGCGHAGRAITCPFHGWRWTLDGKLDRVTNREDFAELPQFDERRLPLQEVRAEDWGGWIFVSMDPEIEPLLDYLAPIPEIIDPFDLDACRIGWHITLTFPCNWKTVINAFNENYHVEMTHAQMNKFGLSKAPAKAHGKHAQFFVQSGGGASNMGTVSRSQFRDPVEMVQVREEERFETLGALSSTYSVAAARRLREAFPDGGDMAEVMIRFRQFHREELEAAGATWPERLTGEDIARAGIDWHLFPNMIFLPSFDGALIYRARPDPADPERCWFDVWWIGRYPEGAAPAYEHIVYDSLEAAKGVNAFLEQDFGNLEAIQKGIHSRGFRGPVYNPVQEMEIINFEKTLDEYLDSDHG